MKEIKNKYVPIKGFKAINLFGILFVRVEAEMKEQDYNHEAIHTKQMKELLYIGFYIWYVMEWLIKLVIYKNTRSAYRAISFEREAYAHQTTDNYCASRLKYHWLTYI